MLEKGIRMFQLREKDLPSDELLNYALRLKEITRGYDSYIFINERVDIAVLSDSNGVHLPEKSIPIEAIKHKFSDLIVGKSCHSLKSAIEAEKNGADYITVAPVFKVEGKGKPLGLEKLKEIVENVSIPVYALGGITEEKIPEVLKTGVYGIAGIRLFIY
jgi:thiamine-phosphate pyrophosphorylase